MTRILGVIGLVLAVCFPRAVGAQIDLGDEDQLLTLTGQVAADRKAAEQSGFSAVSLAFRGDPPDKLVWIGAAKAESWNGDVFKGRAMLDAVQGYTPTMIVAGKAPMIAKLRQAPVGSQIVVQGIFNEGARTFLVGMVEMTPTRGAK